MKIAIIGKGLVGRAILATPFAAADDFAGRILNWGMNASPHGVHVKPLRIEAELRAHGANHIQAGLWRSFAIRDGNLLTGQQHFSGAETAQALVRALGE